MKIKSRKYTSSIICAFRNTVRASITIAEGGQDPPPLSSVITARGDCFSVGAGLVGVF